MPASRVGVELGLGLEINGSRFADDYPRVLDIRGQRPVISIVGNAGLGKR